MIACTCAQRFYNDGWHSKMCDKYDSLVWKQTPMPYDYTCHCGLYVHPQNPHANQQAIHISGCVYEKINK